MPVFLWNFQAFLGCLDMRLFGSAVIAVIVLWLIDIELNHGHYAHVALTVARGVARSIGLP
jgi:hypothetical protein